MKEKFLKIKSYLETDIWKINLNELPTLRKYGLAVVKVILLSVRGYKEHNFGIRASALTFFSVLSVVPVIALAFAIAKGFGLEVALEKSLRENFSGQEDILTYLLDFSHKLLDNAKGGLIAGIGVVLLFISVIRLFEHIENAFNSMWYVKKTRSFARKFTDYLTIMLFAPVLIIMSSSANVFISTYLSTASEKYTVVSYMTPLLVILVKLAPYVFVWVLFTFLYIILPNTKVQIKSAIIAGILAGSAYQVVQWGYISFQIGVGKYNAIYGSFAALPMFLIWMQISWTITLLGAELSYAVQNAFSYRIEKDTLDISNSYRKQLSVLIVHQIVMRFQEEKPPLKIDDLSELLKIPKKFVRILADELCDAHIIAEVRTAEENVFAYIPAMDINKLSVVKIIEKLDGIGNDEITVNDNQDFKTISTIFSQANNSLENSKANILVKDLK